MYRSVKYWEWDHATKCSVKPVIDLSVGCLWSNVVRMFDCYKLKNKEVETILCYLKKKG